MKEINENIQKILDKVTYHVYTDRGWIAIPYDEIICRYCGQHFRSECICEEKTNL